MPSIGVLEHNQKPTDKPMRRIKRSGGQSLVRQQLAYWVIENVLLQMLQVQNETAVLPENCRCHEKLQVRPYIPDKMPPNLDARLGIVVQVPALSGQVRFRHF